MNAYLLPVGDRRCIWDRLGRGNGQTQLTEERKKDLLIAGPSRLGASGVSGTGVCFAGSTNLFLTSGRLSKYALALSFAFAS